jgi:hypothetical protein
LERSFMKAFILDAYGKKQAFRLGETQAGGRG